MVCQLLQMFMVIRRRRGRNAAALTLALLQQRVTESCDLHFHFLSTYLTKMFPSAETGISCLLNQMKRPQGSVQIDANQGKLIQMTPVSINFSKEKKNI